MPPKPLAAAGIAAAVAVAVAVAAGVASPPPATTGTITTTDDDDDAARGIGLVINTPGRSVSPQQADEIFAEAASTGIGRSNMYMFWNVVEPRKGELEWDRYDVMMGLNEKNGLSVTLFFSVINGGTLGPFPDWIGRPPISSIGEERLADVLDAVLTRYHIIDYVILAGDTESQFRYNEQDIPAYRELFTGVYDRLKQRHPDVMFGNSFALHHLLNKDLTHIAGDLAPLGDFVAFSYFPVDSLNDITRTPQEAREDLARVFEIVPEDRRVGFFEVSWSTSGFVGGDAASQDAFLEQLFEFYSGNRSEIEFLTWYRQYDRPEGTCATELQDMGGKGISVGGGSGLGGSEHVVERLGHYVCNAGLVDVNGTPKPGWDQFRGQIEMLRQQQQQQQQQQQAPPPQPLI